MGTGVFGMMSDWRMLDLMRCHAICGYAHQREIHHCQDDGGQFKLTRHYGKARWLVRHVKAGMSGALKNPGYLRTTRRLMRMFACVICILRCAP